MSFVAAVFRVSAGIIVWALHFAALYGATGYACARGVPALVPWTSLIATVIAAGLALSIMVAGYRRRAVFEHWLSATVAAFALLAIVFETIPLLIYPLCD